MPNLKPNTSAALRDAMAALMNAPLVGETYDQQHSDTHLAAYQRLKEVADHLAMTTDHTRLETADADIHRALNSPSAPTWLKHALTTALQRDAVDAAADAYTLYSLLEARVKALLGEE